MILIVDDKPENVFSLEKILKASSFEVDTAFSGEEALKKILKNTYALVILDVQMPGMDGFEVAEAISGLSRTKDTPIIFLSAVNTAKSFIMKGFESGGIDYITKPVDPDILIMKVRTFNRLYEQTRALNKAHHDLQQEMEVRKETEKALSATVEELHLTLESVPQLAFTARPNGQIDFVNQHWFRYSRSQCCFPQTHPDDADLNAVWQEHIASGEAVELEVRILELIFDSYHYHLVRILPVMAEGVIVKWVGTFTNIGQQKHLNEILEQRVQDRTRKLEEINRELEASNHDLQQFAYIASHDLQEPLRKIQLFSSMIRNKINEQPDLTIYLNKIMDSSSQMRKLIEDLLSFSRLTQTKAFQRIDLNGVIQEILSTLEVPIMEKRAHIQLSNLPTLEVIPGLIKQVFQNILSNALKFCQPGVTPVVSVTAEYVTDLEADSDPLPGGPYCRIVVRDNGIGFDEAYAQQIFTLFQRLNHRDQYEGTGIGLAIVKRIVEKHGGTITARSQPGKGATFIIVLPVCQVDVPIPMHVHAKS